MKKILFGLIAIILTSANVSATKMPERAVVAPKAEYVAISVHELDLPEETEEPQKTEEPEPYVPPISYEDVALIAKTIWGEARGLSYYEKCQVAWCILNRVDSEMFPNTVLGVVSQSGQYHGYSSSYPAKGDCYAAALDVYTRWLAEKAGQAIERELDRAYIYFGGDGVHNYYRTVY